MKEHHEFARTVEALHQASLKLRHLGGDAIDAVLHLPSATTYLLPEVQAELQRLERAERQRAAELSAILDALPANLAILDETGTIVAVNEAWRAFARENNFPDDTAALGLNYLTVCREVTGGDMGIAQTVAQGLEGVLSGQRNEVVLEYPCQTPEKLLWFNVMIAPLRGAERAGAVVLHVDITEKQDASKREAELRLRMDRLMDQAGIGILVHRDNVPVFANPALVSMLGYERQDEILAVGDVRRLFHLPQRGEVDLPMEDMLQWRALSQPGRIATVRRDGTPATLDTRVFPLSWGDESALCTMFTDITDQLRIEDQLRAAQKLEAIGQLTGGVAHDFNNLLTVILGNGDLLVEALQHEPRLARLAELTVMMAERGAELTKNLLAFSRRQPLNPRRTDVNGRLVALEELLRRTLGADVEITLNLSENLWPAMVDAGELDGAILNLTINSRDAMPDGGHLTITTDNIELDGQITDGDEDVQPGAYVVVTVSDDGTGMTEDALKRVFEPFFTTKDVGKGSGLGLSMVFGFVRQTGGQVLIDSEPGEGATVRLYLPRFLGEELPTGFVTDKDRREPRGEETILVVEDDSMLRRLVTKQLEDLGYRVIPSSDGESALAILHERSDIDLLFCDIILPGGMNGRQVGKIAQEIRPGIKVLYTSGYSESVLFHQGSLDPGVELVSKPYRRSDLAIKIRRFFNS